jgi:hypothetical protein
VTDTPAAWWPPTRKIWAVAATYVTTLGAAIAGELLSGTPNWSVVLGGAVIGGAGLIAGYLTSDSVPVREEP